MLKLQKGFMKTQNYEGVWGGGDIYLFWAVHASADVLVGAFAFSTSLVLDVFVHVMHIRLTNFILFIDIIEVFKGDAWFHLIKAFNF